MNKKFSISIFVILIFSCNQTGTNKNTKSSNKRSLKIIEKQHDKKNVKKHKELRIHKLKFPANYVIDQFGPAGDGEGYYFYPDNTFLLRDYYYEDDYSTGSWMIENDTIKISTKYHFGYRGIGEENIPPGMETCEHSASYGFDEYVKFYENVEYKFKINPTDISLGHYKIDTTLFANDFTIDPHKFLIDGDFLFASMKELTNTDLEGYSSRKLRLIRNEIFARYGYKFKSKYLVDYFNAKDWYKPQKDNVDIYLTGLEKKNIDLIKKIELREK